MSECKQYLVWFVTHTHFLWLFCLTKNKTHRVITKICIYNQSYPETMSSNDSLDCFQRQLSWLRWERDRQGGQGATTCPPPPPSHLYPLETLRDIYVNLLFTISVPHPRNDWILTEFELPMLARGRVSIQQYNGHFGKTILCCRELSYILQNISSVTGLYSPNSSWITPPPAKNTYWHCQMPPQEQNHNHCLRKLITKEDNFNTNLIEATFSEASASPCQSKWQESPKLNTAVAFLLDFFLYNL